MVSRAPAWAGPKALGGVLVSLVAIMLLVLGCAGQDQVSIILTNSPEQNYAKLTRKGPPHFRLAALLLATGVCVYPRHRIDRPVFLRYTYLVLEFRRRQDLRENLVYVCGMYKHTHIHKKTHMCPICNKPVQF